MKRLIILFTALVLITSALSAASLFSSVVSSSVKAAAKAEQRKAREGMTIKGLDAYLNTVNTNTMSTQQKSLLYDSKKLDSPVWATILNLTVGFGIGSARVGDRTGEIVGIVLDSVAFAVIGAPLIMMTLDILFAMQLFKGVWNEDFLTMMLIGGGSLLVVSHVIQAFLPAAHVRKYNNRLQEGLGLTNQQIGFAVAPTFDGGFTAVASISF